MTAVYPKNGLLRIVSMCIRVYSSALGLQQTHRNITLCPVICMRVLPALVQLCGQRCLQTLSNMVVRFVQGRSSQALWAVEQ